MGDGRRPKSLLIGGISILVLIAVYFFILYYPLRDKFGESLESSFFIGGILLIFFCLYLSCYGYSCLGKLYQNTSLVTASKIQRYLLLAFIVVVIEQIVEGRWGNRDGWSALGLFIIILFIFCIFEAFIIFWIGVSQVFLPLTFWMRISGITKAAILVIAFIFIITKISFSSWILKGYLGLFIIGLFIDSILFFWAYIHYPTKKKTRKK